MSVTRADLLTRLRNPAQGSASTLKSVLLTGAACADMREAADEIERLRGLVESFEEILSECENDFHACEQCGYQDDNATKESDLFVLLRAAIKEQGGSDVNQQTTTEKP